MFAILSLCAPLHRPHVSSLLALSWEEGGDKDGGYSADADAGPSEDRLTIDMDVVELVTSAYKEVGCVISSDFAVAC